MKEYEQEAIYSIIGTRIREFRNKNQKSQQELANKVGVSRTSIVNIEKGRQRLPIHVLWNIADELNVEPSSFIPDRKKMQNQPNIAGINTKTLKLINNKSQGNADTRKKLLDFINAK